VPATVLATVREWNEEEGWGVLDATGCPDGARAHLFVITGDGDRTPDPGEGSGTTSPWRSTMAVTSAPTVSSG